MISVTLRGVDLAFETDPTLFSPSGVDAGTLAMLSAVEFRPEDKVLDLGCGWGVVGILAARLVGEDRVTLCDVSPQAAACALKNAARNGVPGVSVLVSDGLAAIEDRDFTLILSNPPYHADFAVPRRFIEEGFRKLAVGGRMVMVTKRLEWYRRKLTAVFGGVRVREIDGYYVFFAEKRSPAVPKKEKSAGGLSKKLRRKYGDR